MENLEIQTCSIFKHSGMVDLWFMFQPLRALLQRYLSATCLVFEEENKLQRSCQQDV